MAVNRRLETFKNEQIDLTAFFCRRNGYMYPTHAGFELYGEAGNVGIFTEDLKAMEKAGYSIKQSAGPIDPPISVILHEDRDRIAYVVGPNGTFEVRRANEGRAEVVSITSAPADDEPDRIISGPFGRKEATPPTQPAPKETEHYGNLFIKIARVMADVKRVEKTKGVPDKNGREMYKVATGDDLLDMLRPIMAAHKLVCIPNMDRVVIEGDNGEQYHGYFTFTLADGDSGQTLSRQWESQVKDYSDKAINKLSRFATRYFFTNLFQLSTGDVDDDPELGPNDTAPATPKKQVKKLPDHVTQQQRPPKQEAPAQPKNADNNGMAPANLISAVKNDKGIKALGANDKEVFNTINAVWRDENMSEDETGIQGKLTQLVMDRLQIHKAERAEAQS